MNTKAVLSSENMKNKCSRKENICSNRPCTISNCDHKRQKSLIYKKKLPKLCCEDDKCNCWTITNSKINSGNPSAESQSTGDGSSVDDGEAKRQRKIPIGRSCNGGEHCCRKHLMPASAPCDHEQKPGCGAAGDQPQQQPATGVGVPPLTNHQSLKHCDCTHADSFEPVSISFYPVSS